jgi:hypothetical protein
MPGLTPAWRGMLAEAASVCLERQGHGVTVDLTVSGEIRERVGLERLEVDVQMRSAHRHEETATEHGAYGVALLSVCRLAGRTVFSQSWKGDGFDYWLIPEDQLQFQDSVLLEVSGIRRGTEKTVRSRIRDKIFQVRTHFPYSLNQALIAVVEFSRPEMRLVKP